MKVSKKIPVIAYTVLCIILLICLLGGIQYVVAIGERFREDAHANANYNGDTELLGAVITKQLPSDANVFEIDIPYGTVLMLPTDKEEAYMEYSSERTMDIHINENLGKCEVDIEITRRLNWSLNHLFNWSEKESIIRFYLPKDDLKELSIDMEAGNLTVRDMESKVFIIDVEAGNAVIKDCKFESIDTNVEAGNIELYVDENTMHVDSDVSVGNMSIFLPEDISGFTILYDVEMGDLNNQLSFDIIEDAQNTQIISKHGKIIYGDESCGITLDVEVGNVSLYEYKE